MNSSQKFMSITLILNGLTTLITLVRVGPISGLGLLTISLFIVSWFFIFNRRKISKATLPVLPLLLFVITALISWMWNSSQLAPISVIQNMSVYLGFIGFIILSAIESSRTFHLPEYITKYIPRAVQVSVTIYGMSVLVFEPGNNNLMGARPFALFAIIGIAWFLAAWRYGLPGAPLWSILTILTIAFSFSRTSLLISLVLFPLSQISFTSIKSLMRIALIIVMIVIVSYLAFTYVEPIRSRFSDTGDNATVGGVQVNTSGRGTAWPVAIASAWESPWIGKLPVL